MSKKLNEEFNILTDEEISQCTDIQNALELINKENIITEIEPQEAKKFIVQKNENINLSPSELTEKNDVELNEIANQADQAFYDLMDISINSSGKSCAEIANAANGFLNIKLNARIAKLENKLKNKQYELNVKKYEASLKKNTVQNEDDEDDGIVIIENDK